MDKPHLNYSMREGTEHFVVTVTLEANDFEFGTVITGTADKTIAEILEAKTLGKDIYAAVMGSYCPFITEVNNGLRFGVMQETNGVLLDFRLDCNSSESGEIWACRALYYPIENEIVHVPFEITINGGTIIASTSASFENVKAAVVAKKNIVADVSIFDGSAVVAPLVAYNPKANPAVLVFATVYKGSGSADKPTLYQIGYSNEAVTFEAVELT